MTPPIVLETPAAPAPVACSRTHATHDGFDVVCLRSEAGLEAVFAPQVGMACCSLQDAGTELLGERFGLAAYAGCGVTMGMSLMHPWADRLSDWKYTASGASVRLPVSPLLHTDRWGLPVNGVQSCGHAWVVEDSGVDADSAWLEATLPFDRDPRQLALFPFPHRVHLRADVSGSSLHISAEIEATGRVPVPVCFGYRVYLQPAGPGGGATMVLPERTGVLTDARLLPTGTTEERPLSALSLDAEDLREVFALGPDRRLTVASDTSRLTLESLGGFPLAQASSVRTEPHVMLEALTAPPDALSRGRFPEAAPGRPYRASLRLSSERLSSDRSRLAA